MWGRPAPEAMAPASPAPAAIWGQPPTPTPGLDHAQGVETRVSEASGFGMGTCESIFCSGTEGHPRVTWRQSHIWQRRAGGDSGRWQQTAHKGLSVSHFP